MSKGWELIEFIPRIKSSESKLWASFLSHYHSVKNSLGLWGPPCSGMEVIQPASCLTKAHKPSPKRESFCCSRTVIFVSRWSGFLLISGKKTNCEVNLKKKPQYKICIWEAMQIYKTVKQRSWKGAINLKKKHLFHLDSMLCDIKHHSTEAHGFSPFCWFSIFPALLAFLLACEPPPARAKIQCELVWRIWQCSYISRLPLRGFSLPDSNTPPAITYPPQSAL